MTEQLLNMTIPAGREFSHWSHCLECGVHSAVYRDGDSTDGHSATCSKNKYVADMVNHPTHYNQGGYEAADIIEAFELPYHVGTVVKYALRFQFKGERLTDLRKAAWHLARQIKLEEGNMDAVGQ